MSFQDDSRGPDTTESMVLSAASVQGGSVDTVFPSTTRPRTAEGQAEDRPEAEEIGGPQGAEPTRFGDWERNGRCSDF